MTINYRIRNVVIAAALAAAAVLLTVIYVNAAQEDKAAANESVTVYVPTKDFSAGTAGSKVAASVEAQSVSQKTAVSGAIDNPDAIKGLYLTQPVYRGEQLTLKRFALPEQQGIRAQLVGKQRAIQVPGTAHQILAGTLVPGDRVDVVANLKDPKDLTTVKTATVLRNLRVLQTQDGDGGSKLETDSSNEKAVILAVTDAQAQRLYFVMQNGDWSLQLRPVKKPKDSTQTTDGFTSVLDGGAK